MRLLLPLLALMTASALAQPVDYFPLGASDSWTFGVLVAPPDAPRDTLRYPPVQIQSTATVRDTVYPVVSVPSLSALSDSLRVDTEGRVWGRHSGNDLLLLDVTLADGATYEVEAGTFGTPYTVTVQREPTLNTLIGTVENAISFFFDVPEVVDEELYIALAPGVGIVQAGAGLSFLSLVEATVSGTVILNSDDGPESPTLRAFPNPFASALTIELPRGDWRTVELVDALGRQVAALPAGPCVASICRLTWDASPAAPGVYVVRATGPSGTAHQRVVRMR